MPWFKLAFLIWLYLTILDLFGLILILYRSYAVKLAELVEQVRERLAENEELKEKNETLVAENQSLQQEKDRLSGLCAEQAAEIDYAEDELTHMLGLDAAPTIKKSKKK